MSNSVQILYNNKDVFSGIAPVPFVSINQEFIDFGTKWNQITNITLEGQLTGKYLGPKSYYYLNQSVKQLLSGFNENYKSLRIIDKSKNSTVLDKDIAIVNSINIDESPWYGILPFNINLSIYDQNLFNNHYGVVEPEETFTFSDEEDDILSLSHKLSAKGIITSSNNAIENAKSWVLSRTGNINKINPILVNNAVNKNFILESTRENIDRFNGVYSWEASYKKNINPESPVNCFLNYSIDLSSGSNDGFVVGKIDGTLKGNSVDVLRTEYNKLNLYYLTNTAAFQSLNKVLSNRTIAQSIDENPNENLLSFSATFNDDFSSEIINNYSVDINQDVLKCVNTVNFRTSITARYGDRKSRWQKVYNFYKNLFFPFSLANEEYRKEVGGSTRGLNINPINETIAFNEVDAEIVYTAQYTNKISTYSEDILNMSSNVNLTPSKETYVAKTSAFTPREHNIQDLNCANRTIVKFDVSTSVKMNKSFSIAESTINNELNRLRSIYVNGSDQILEERNVSKNNDIKTMSISETWSFEGTIF